MTKQQNRKFWIRITHETWWYQIISNNYYTSNDHPAFTKNYNFLEETTMNAITFFKASDNAFNHNVEYTVPLDHRADSPTT